MQQQKPQGFLVAGGIPPAQGSGRIVTAVAARTRAAEQMAFEDVWKALNPDFRTPFASVEDAISRLLPYHIFADYEEDDDVVDPISGISSSICTTTEKSSAHNWEDGMVTQMEGFLEHFEKQVLTFNVMTQQHAAGFNRAEEQLILQMSMVEDERRQLELLRAAIVQHQQQEAARARLALAQPQAALPAASCQALVAAGRGEGASRGQALAPSLVMQQQETMMTAGAWQALAAAASRGQGASNEQALMQAIMAQHMQRQRQQEIMAAASRGDGATCGQAEALPLAAVTQLMQQRNQQRQQEEMTTTAFRCDVAPGYLALASAGMMRQQQQHQQEVMAAGGWQLDLGLRHTDIAPRVDGSSSSQAALPPAMLQQPGQGQASTAGSGMALPWRGVADGREQ
ncbi:hypothetical protein Zm00014a_004291 [Zea mays]|uniref:OSJNBa0055C08.12-like protein n=3 Tax=Zea mays TaxID=4577 RepID=A0A1D6ECE1_MAIZE|nr:uncharacterized protein LOC103646558 [Zea mays]ONM17986.1 OSJNBa0055C08.12-like protein [Zea mays]PWZ41547.1 hypothetical protein Zm00014a_004291 [Zea mays]|eukprot:XP_008669499.1 uncharacterized protein LOC103646558 [Zea mays]